MEKKFMQVLISATSKKEADKISDGLVKNKLCAGTLITEGASRYWWQGKIVEKQYYNISAFSLNGNKKKIIEIVKNNHSDDCPIIAFYSIDGNREFLEWIRKSTKQ